LVAFVVGTLAAATAGPAAAATLTVNTTIDEMIAGDSQCSLREAIQAVDDPSGPNRDCRRPGSGAEAIVLGPHVYALRIIPAGSDDNTTGDLNVTASAVTIVGAGEHATTIRTSVQDRLLSVAAGASMSVTNLTLTGGHAPRGSSALLDAAGGAGGTEGRSSMPACSTCTTSR
jgi:CSLREA domain-containing protein